MDELRVDGERLWDSLMEMAKFGATPRGGCCRLALTEADKAGRDLFVGWCREAGLMVTVDRMGSIFARRAGADDSLPPVVTGSHLDTQPRGGKFDGVYGVLAGLEVMRTLNDAGLATRAPVEVCVWTNEEGVRFAPAMIASGVFAGVFDLEFALGRADTEGRTIGEELRRIGYAGDAPVGGRPFKAVFEAHIEQGPILENEGTTIGVVTGVQGVRWYDVKVTGAEGHAGPTPMGGRRDALLGAARMVEAVNRVARNHAPHGRTTVGILEAKPRSRNTIPGEAYFTVDLRHPDADAVEVMHRELGAALRAAARELDLEVALEEVWYSPPVVFDSACIEAVREAARRTGYAHMDIVSGAGHDSCYIARVAPTAMIFVPCAGGVSHNEAESATPEDLAAGCNVLLHALLARAIGSP